MEKWERGERARQRRRESGTNRAGDDQPAPLPKIRMHADDSDNFLKLAAALKVILARSIRTADLARARALLNEYLQGYLKVR